MGVLVLIFEFPVLAPLTINAFGVLNTSCTLVMWSRDVLSSGTYPLAEARSVYFKSTPSLASKVNCGKNSPSTTTLDGSNMVWVLLTQSAALIWNHSARVLF